MRVTRLLLPTACLACACAVATGCASGGGDRNLTVVATTTQVADLVRTVAGRRAEVVGVLAPNSDPHDYEVRPSDVKALIRARLVVRSGGDVDGWLQDAIDGAGSHAPVLDLLAHVGAEDDDPHWWQDPSRAAIAVGAIADALSGADPAGTAGYRRRARAYERRLRALDAGVRRCVDGLPAAERKLVTTHDALGYFARRYGLRVIGAVIPSLSSQGQASAGDLAALVDAIRHARVHAVFIESAVNSDVERAIARESGAMVGRPLWVDALGPPGSGGATYVDSIRSNTAAIVQGLSGGRRTCSLPR